MDDNKKGMPALSYAIYEGDSWFDGFYQMRTAIRRKWVPRTAEDRFDNIINTAFAIKSDHSSLVQVADILSYVYRRNLELRTNGEAYEGERAFYQELVALIEPARAKLGQCTDCEALTFYRRIAPDGWRL